MNKYFELLNKFGLILCNSRRFSYLAQANLSVAMIMGAEITLLSDDFELVCEASLEDKHQYNRTPQNILSH